MIYIPAGIRSADNPMGQPGFLDEPRLVQLGGKWVCRGSRRYGSSATREEAFDDWAKTKDWVIVYTSRALDVDELVLVPEYER